MYPRYLHAPDRAFRSLDAFRKEAKRRGLRVIVTKSKTNTYYQAIHKVVGIVGFFTTAHGGMLRGGEY